MRALLLGAAAMLATTFPSVPAQAKDDSPAFSFRSGSPEAFPPDFRFGGRSDDRRHHRRDRGDSFVYIDREYQGDTAWRRGSFNDWWHDSPHRAYPAWVLRNQDCAREWFQGNVLTC